MGVSAPSLHRESTDSLIYMHILCCYFSHRWLYALCYTSQSRRLKTIADYSESQYWKVRLQHVSKQTIFRCFPVCIYSGGVLLRCASHSAHLLSTTLHLTTGFLLQCYTFLIGGEKLLSCIYSKVLSLVACVLIRTLSEIQHYNFCMYFAIDKVMSSQVYMYILLW